MATYTLTAIDTTGIQPYLFGTNSLRQNAGASYLVNCATRTWVQEVLTANSVQHNIINIDDPEDPFSTKSIEGDELQAEVLYAGGGNTLLLFESKTRAVETIKALTEKVLLAAPGLQLVVAHYHDFDFDNDALGGKDGVLQKVMEKLAESKQTATVSYPTLGLGVTSRCVFTDLPAVAYDKDGNPVSAEAWAKEQAEFDPAGAKQNAYGRLTNLIDFGDYKPARDFDDLGASHGEASFMAVVHADGNRMGERILEIGRRYSTPSANRMYINALRSFSLSVDRAAVAALNTTVDLMKQRVQETEIYDARGTRRMVKAIGQEVLLSRDPNDQAWILPFRPIVFGGDDVTFVCEGRLGLSLAAYYLQSFTAQILDDGEPAYCRAGVAVVHTHHPFAQAYTLAEKLCDSAGDYIRRSANIAEGMTAIDWHYAVGGVIEDLDGVRRREYTSDTGLKNWATSNGESAGDLLMRPVRITDPDWDWRSWNTFRRLAQEFASGKQWKNRRNKVKALRTALRRGSAAVEQFRLLYLNGELLPEIPELLDMEEQGWQGGECGYYDAVEAADVFLDLEKELEPVRVGGSV